MTETQKAHRDSSMADGRTPVCT